MTIFQQMTLHNGPDAISSGGESLKKMAMKMPNRKREISPVDQ